MFKNYIEVNIPLLFLRIVALFICILSIFTFQIGYFSDSYLLDFTPKYTQYGELWAKIYAIYFDRGKYVFSVCSIAILGLMLSGWKSYKDSKLYGLISYCFSIFLLIANYVTLLIMSRFSIKCWGDWSIICFVIIGILAIILILNIIYHIKMRANIVFGTIIKKIWMALLICFVIMGSITSGYIKTYATNREDIQVRYSKLREQYINMAYLSFLGKDYNTDYYMFHPDEIGYIEDGETNPAELYIITKFISYYDNVDGQYDYAELEAAVRNLTNNTGDWGILKDFYDSYSYIKDNGIRDDGFEKYHLSDEFDLTKVEFRHGGAKAYAESVAKYLYELGYEDYANLDYDILDEACVYVYEIFEVGKLDIISLDNPLELFGTKTSGEYEFTCDATAGYMIYNVTTTDTFIKVELLSKVGYKFSEFEPQYQITIDGITYTDITINEPEFTTANNNQYLVLFITP